MWPRCRWVLRLVLRRVVDLVRLLEPGLGIVDSMVRKHNMAAPVVTDRLLPGLVTEFML